jgi:NDP-sugar pyrophosphorylase family protein
MTNFPAKDFFVLDQRSHRDLWQGTENVWEALQRLNSYLAQATYSVQIDIPNHVYLEKPELIAIGENTIIEPGAYIEGPCVIGSGCIIRHGAYLRSGVICGDHCVIGHGTELKQSILLHGAQAAHFAYVGNCILGNYVNLGAGVKCANLRLDRCEVTVSYMGEKIRTGLKKFGCVIGDRAQIGCNAVINPGTLLGSDSFVYPLVNISGVIPAHTQIKSKNGGIDLVPLENSAAEEMIPHDCLDRKNKSRN